ncbi:MAG TPA: beta-ketoacyl-ACP synthase II [Gemmatales bacterium]|nr:beta-ketoacyl-ACP synthase II [Gemmatales bacterium]HMP58979.1 beta-ketoacyl-ACP synthase II [Gemmatales bacterium]
MSRRRVVITGMGVVTNLGNRVTELWDNLLAGKSGIGPWTLFDASAYKVRFGGEVRKLELAPHIDVRLARRLDRFAQFALLAGIEAIKDSGLELIKIEDDSLENVYQPAKTDPWRIACVIGSGIGGLNEFEEQHLKLVKSGPTRVSPFVIPKLMSNAAPAQISIYHGFRGPNLAVSTACASAANAIGDAMRMIQYGECDVIVTGGSEAAMTTMGLSGFIQARALSERNDAPEKASRPWDKDRDGFVLSEGAGILVIEDLEHARRRGARIYAELLGYGTTADSFNITAPCPDGSGAAKAMELTLRDAQLQPEQINHINAHGTSTPLGDVAETVAIKRVFGAHAPKIAINSTKSQIGHTLGASGGIAAIVTALAITRNIVHATINLDTPDPECDLDYVPNQPREMKVSAALINSFGFGGHNACLAIGPVR